MHQSPHSVTCFLGLCVRSGSEDNLNYGDYSYYRWKVLRIDLPVSPAPQKLYMRISILTFSYLILLELLPLCVCVCVCTCTHMRALSLVQLFATPWTIAHRTIAHRNYSSSVHGIPQARKPEWAVISCSRGSSQPRDQTQVSSVPCIGRDSFPPPGSPPITNSLSNHPQSNCILQPPWWK